MDTNPVALVVGAGDYIGAAISRRFAAGGYTVCMGRRNGEKLELLVAEIEHAGGRAHGYTLDAREGSASTKRVRDHRERRRPPRSGHL